MYVECEKKNFAGRIYRGQEACFFISQILTHKDHRSHHEPDELSLYIGLK